MPSRLAQPYLPGFGGLKEKDFGGSLLGKGNPRQQRPLSFKRPLHLVMRSSQAVRERSLLSPRRSKEVENIVRRTARQRGIRVYRYANSGNHLHVLIKVPSPRAYRAYVRAISGLIARLVLGTERGAGRKPAPAAKREAERKPALGAGKKQSSEKSARFWDARPFTRIIEWGRDYLRACDYLLQNRLEALGFIPYRHRGKQERRRQKPPD